MVVGIGGIGGSRVGGQSCAGSLLSPSGRSPPCGNADDFAASEADHDGATCSNSAVAAIRNRRGCMPHTQIEHNLTISKIHSLNGHSPDGPIRPQFWLPSAPLGKLDPS